MSKLTGVLIPAAFISFLITAAFAPVTIPILRKLKFGQSIREDGPKWHQSKAGTPTMGGLLFILGITTSTLIYGGKLGDTYRLLATISMALSFGFIGFADDYIKVVKKRNLGLTARQKMFLQLICAGVFLLTMKTLNFIDTSLYIPYINTEIELGIFYYVFAMFVIIAIVNAVNFTDGLDGLASSVTIPVVLVYAAIAILLRYYSISIFLVAVAGGLAGFLIFNIHPAKVFMGDTGSMFLGAAIAASAITLNMTIIFLVIGFIYVAEMVSVVLQIIYFKITKGKRLFKMSPLHHHFELSGWSEGKIVSVFTIITVILCIIGYLGVVNYYII